MEGVIEELQCPICLDLYKDPIILPCSHVLCNDPCAARLFDGSFVRCPVCRESSFVSGGLDNLPRVKTLVNIIERYQNGGRDLPAPMDVCTSADQPCHLCRGTPKKAYRRCIDCKAAYCRMCLELSHPNKEPFLQHHLVEPTKNVVAAKVMCPVHEQMVNVYCDDCRTLGCLLCADERSNHLGHKILSVKEAYDRMKGFVESGVQKLEEGHTCVKGAIKTEKGTLDTFQANIDDSKTNVNSQCDVLIQEIQSKREFFLSDLEYEERNKKESLKTQLETLQKKASNAKSVLGYAKEVLNETDPLSFLQLANPLLQKLDKTTGESSFTWKPNLPSLKHRVVDTRKERAVIRDLSYLTVPATPTVDVSKCARSPTSVVIVLCPPTADQDVIDGYKVYYCTQEQKESGEQNTVFFETPMEERRYSRGGTVAASTVCLIHNDLLPETVYWFSVRSYNMAGESPGCEDVHCTTLSESEANNALPRPEISESMCRMYTTSIQVYSQSPVDHPEDSPDGIIHYLLYRESGGHKLWKSISLYGRLDHRVFGLEPDTLYDFVIMACDKNGQCQVSNEVSLRTERAAF